MGPPFQVLFHSPPGVLFTFPSRYYALSVAAEYSALEGGPPCFRLDSSCPGVLRYGAKRTTPAASPLPVWAPPRSLAATGGISFDFLSCGYLDGSLPRVFPPRTI